MLLGLFYISSYLIPILLCIMSTPAAKAMKVAVVTGSNKGIGLEIAKKLCTGGLKTVMACRNEDLGMKAVAELNAAGFDAEFRLCDIASPESIDAFICGLKKDYSSIDVLVNNAAIAFKNADPTPFEKQARVTLNTNYFGTQKLSLDMLPLLYASKAGRIVNIASQSGQLKILKSPSKKAIFTSSTLTIDELSAAMNEFISEVESSGSENSWSNTCYGMSKLGVIALTKVMARENPGISINACCPGWCATDMSSHGGPRTAEKGAETPVMLSLEESVGSGGFYFDGKILSW